MKEIIIKDKQNYLNENYPFTNIPDLSEKQKCIHCDSIIVVGDYKVFKDNFDFVVVVEFLFCFKFCKKAFF